MFTGAFLKLPDGWLPGPVCFHPTEPMLFQAVKRSVVQSAPVLWAHSLLEPTLRILGMQATDSIANLPAINTNRLLIVVLVNVLH